MKDIDQLQLDDRVKDTSPKPGQVPGVFYVDPDVMTKYIDSAVQVMVKDSLKILMNDQAWVDKIQQLVTVDIVNRVSDKLSLVDINSLVADNLVVALDRYHSKIVENLHLTVDKICQEIEEKSDKSAESVEKLQEIFSKFATNF